MNTPSGLRRRSQALHPNQSVIQAVLALTTAEQQATSATLTLRQASALLTHLRRVTRLALRESKGAPSSGEAPKE